jgi:hypothetical protein
MHNGKTRRNCAILGQKAFQVGEGRKSSSVKISRFMEFILVFLIFLELYPAHAKSVLQKS